MMQRRQRNSHPRSQNGQGNRSYLLHDFLNRRRSCANIGLGDIVSHVCAFARDRDGSKFIQSQLADASDYHKFIVYSELRPILYEIMVHRYGNFIVQIFIEIGNDEQRQEILQVIQTYFMPLSQHMYGCRVVQKAIKCMPFDSESTILGQFCLGSNLSDLARNMAGNHVVQTAFEIAAVDVQNVLFTSLQPHVNVMCFHVNGCRVIQCILKHGSDLLRSHIFCEILTRPIEMVQDRYANYVIQFAVEFGTPDMRYYLNELVLRDIIFLSAHKYSSNVVETCAGFATPEQQKQALDLICKNDARWMKRFCLDQFANYVMQKLIEVADWTQVNLLRMKLEPYFNEMERHVCGLKIVNQLEQRKNEVETEFQQIALIFQQLNMV